MCAVSLGGCRCSLLPFDPISLVLAQRNGVEPQRNALMGAATGAGWSRPPLPFGSKPQHHSRLRQADLSARSTHHVQANLTHQFVPLGLRAEWERRVGPPSSCGGFKALFFGGSTPFLWASTKEMGSNGSREQRQPPKETAHTHNPPTTTKPLPKVGRR